MSRTVSLGLSLAYFAVASTAASAHPGDHASFGWRSLATHLIKPDHLVFIALIAAVGVLAFGLGCRAERRIRDRSRR